MNRSIPIFHRKSDAALSGSKIWMRHLICTYRKLYYAVLLPHTKEFAVSIFTRSIIFHQTQRCRHHLPTTLWNLKCRCVMQSLIGPRIIETDRGIKIALWQCHIGLNEPWKCLAGQESVISELLKHACRSDRKLYKLQLQLLLLHFYAPTAGSFENERRLHTSEEFFFTMSQIHLKRIREKSKTLLTYLNAMLSKLWYDIVTCH